MARTDTLGNFLTDVADAIREKKGTTDTIPASNFDTEIASIESGVDINEYFNLTKRKIGDATYYIKKLPMIDTSDYTSFYRFFNSIGGLEELPEIDTSKGTEFGSIIYRCNNLKKVPMFDLGNATSTSGIFDTGNNIINIDYHGGYKDVGKAYSTTASANNNNYTIQLNYVNIPHDSLMNIINNLYDIKTKGVKPQKLILGSDNLAKLSEEERNIAVSKGWTLS